MAMIVSCSEAASWTHERQAALRPYPAEIAALGERRPATRAQIAADCDALLASFTCGDYGLAEPKLGETPLAMRRPLSAAAQRRGWKLDFVPTEGEELVCRVCEDVGG